MAGNQRVYKARIKSTQSLKKIFRAMELIAASRIGKARARVAATVPYADAITRAVGAVATHSATDHPSPQNVMTRTGLRSLSSLRTVGWQGPTRPVHCEKQKRSLSV